MSNASIVFIHAPSISIRGAPSARIASGNIAILSRRVKRLTPGFVGGLRGPAYNADFAKEQNMRVVEKALTFDDVLLVPAHSTILPREVSLKTQLTRSIA